MSLAAHTNRVFSLKSRRFCFAAVRFVSGVTGCTVLNPLESFNRHRIFYSVAKAYVHAYGAICFVSVLLFNTERQKDEH
jgi:hypothetical protein